MKQLLYSAALGTMLSTAVYTQELKIGSPMPDPAKLGGHFLDNPIQDWGTCIIQINRYTDAQGKRLKFLSAYPDMGWEDRNKPYLVWDIDSKKFYVDSKRKDGKGKFGDGRGPDGFIDEIVEGEINILEKHPFCAIEVPKEKR